MKANYSKLIQGCMTWGIWGKNFSISDMSKHISKTIELGLTTFDHADIYGNYTTEASFGEAFKKTGVDRNKIQLISKCGIQLVNEDRGSYVKHYQYSKDYIIAQAEQSLQNLKTDHLDLFLLHRPSPLMQLDEVKEAITQLKNQGKILAFGVSNFSPAQVDFLKDDLEISVNQIQCSLTQVTPFEYDSLFYHQKNHITTMAWSPLGGFYKLDKAHSLRLALSQMANTYSCTETELILAWLLNHPAGIHPVLGTTSHDHLQQAINSLDIRLNLQDWFVLFEAARGKEVD